MWLAIASLAIIQLQVVSGLVDLASNQFGQAIAAKFTSKLANFARELNSSEFITARWNQFQCSGEAERSHYESHNDKVSQTFWKVENLYLESQSRLVPI